MRIRLEVLPTILVLYMGAYALDSSEAGAQKTMLKVYSGGFAAGGVVPLNRELEEQSRQLLKLSFINSVYFREPVRFFFDVNVFLPGTNLGADAGFDFVTGNENLGAFIGAGIGAHYLGREGADFGDNFGPSLTAHAGLQFDLTDQVQVRFRVPYHIIANRTRDHIIGLDMGVLFSSRFKNVRKLVY